MPIRTRRPNAKDNEKAMPANTTPAAGTEKK